jgi:hypothetical protein
MHRGRYWINSTDPFCKETCLVGHAVIIAPSALQVKFANIPNELQELPQWLLWKFETDSKGRRKKVPYSVQGHKAGVKKKSAWSSFENIQEGYLNGEWDGIFFVLTESDPFCGLDLDHVVRGKKVCRWMEKQASRFPVNFPHPKEIDSLFDSYTEKSPGGDGLRILCRGELPGSGRKMGDFEIYDRLRLLSITGHCRKGTQIVDAQDVITELYRRLPRRKEQESIAQLDWCDKHPQGISDNRIQREMKSNINALALWGGKLDGYGSHSEADLALVNYLAYYAGPYPAIIDRLFRMSKLVRAKWEERDDYRLGTLNTVIASKDKFHSWKGPKINLPDSCLPYRSFPLSAYPSAVRQYVVRSAESIGTDPAMIAVPLLSVLAGLIGQSRRLYLKSTYHEPAILWTATIAPVGSAKSPSVGAAQLLMKDVLKLLRLNNRKQWAQYSEELADWQQDKEGPKPVRPTPKQLLVQNTTLEALNRRLAANWKGLIYIKDELAGWIKSFNQYRKGADAESWLTLHNGQCEVVDRSQDDAHTECVDFTLSLTGTIQPEVAQEVLFSKDTTQNGLAQRLLICVPPFELVNDDGKEHLVDADLVKQMRRLGRSLYELESKMGPENDPLSFVLKQKASAKHLLLDFKNSTKREAHEMEGPVAGVWHKLNAQCARIALVLSVTRQILENPKGDARRPITVKDVEAAIQIAEWFGHEARRFYGRLDESLEEKEQRELWQWIRKKHPRGITPRELQQGKKALPTAAEARERLEELVEARYGKLKKRKVSSGPAPLEFIPRNPVYESSTGEIKK